MALIFIYERAKMPIINLSAGFPQNKNNMNKIETWMEAYFFILAWMLKDTSSYVNVEKWKFLLECAKTPIKKNYESY